MGRGRTPCCEKIGLKKGPWTQAEDMRLRAFIKKHGHVNWRALPERAGLLRCGKSCRLRWTNYLRPDIKRGNFTPNEEDTIIKLHELIGNKWSTIASQLPGRTDNEIKNVWNTHLKKRLVSKETNFSIDEPTESSCSSSCSSILHYNHSEGTGYPDQVHEKSESGSHPEVYNWVPAENMLDPFEEILEIPIEPHLDLWDVLDDDSSLLLERRDDEIMNSVNAYILEQLVQQETNPSIDDPKESSIEERSLSPDGSKTPPEAHDMMHREKEQGPSEMPEFPIEPDYGFWDILDVDSYLFTSNARLLIDKPEEILQNTTLEEETKREAEESKMWITDLEEELDLWETSDDNTQYPFEPLDPNPSSEVEIDPVATYFHVWPSSPLIF